MSFPDPLDQQALEVSISELLVATADGYDAVLDKRITDVLLMLRKQLRMDVVFVSEFVDGERVFRFIEGGEPLGLRAGDSGPLEQSYCQRVVEGHQLFGSPAQVRDFGAQCQGHQLRVALLRHAFAGHVDEQGTHRAAGIRHELAGRRKAEVLPALEVEVQLVGQRPRGDRRPFAGQPRPRQPQDIGVIRAKALFEPFRQEAPGPNMTGGDSA